MKERSFCNFLEQQLLIGNPRPRASNKTLMIQKLPRQKQYSNNNNKCRLCMSGVEDTGHILANCPQITSRLCLRQDEVVKTFL